MTLTAGRQTLVESKPPTQADFKNDGIRFSFDEMQQRHRGRDFEISRTASGITIGNGIFVHRAYNRLQPINERDQFVGSTGLAVDDEPFFDAFQMGRAKKPGAIPGGSEYARDHGRRGTFALRARNVNDFHADVGLAQPRQQLAHAIEL